MGCTAAIRAALRACIEFSGGVALEVPVGAAVMPEDVVPEGEVMARDCTRNMRT